MSHPSEVTIDLTDVRTAAMLAAELGVTRSQIAMWSARRETNGFPEPVVTISGEGARPIRLYSREEVRQWLTSTT